MRKTIALDVDDVLIVNVEDATSRVGAEHTFLRSRAQAPLNSFRH